MAQTTRSRKRPSGSSSDEWLTLAEARAILDVMSEDIVRAWAEKYGWRRGHANPDGSLIVSKADVLHEKAVREGLGAIGGDELTQQELETLRNARPGTLPWEREKAKPVA